MRRDNFSDYLLPLGVAGHQLEVEQVGLWSDRRYQDSPQIHLETWPSHVQQVVYNNLQSNSKEQSTRGCRLQFTKWEQVQHNNGLHFSADEAFDGTYHTNVIVTSEGMWCAHTQRFPDKLTNRYVHLHPPRHLQVHLQDRHHLVPLRRPGLRHEVWQLDVWRIQGEARSSTSPISIMSIVINMFKVDLKLKAEAGDLGTYTNNGEWDLLSEPKIFSKYLWAKHRHTLKIWKSPKIFWKRLWTNYRHTWVRRVQKYFSKAVPEWGKVQKYFAKHPEANEGVPE